MKQITFDEMLISNGLPPINTVVTTPRGDKIKVVGYAYEKDRQTVVIQFDVGYFDWTFDQIKLCTWEGK